MTRETPRIFTVAFYVYEPNTAQRFYMVIYGWWAGMQLDRQIFLCDPWRYRNRIQYLFLDTVDLQNVFGKLSTRWIEPFERAVALGFDEFLALKSIKMMHQRTVGELQSR